MDMGGYPQGIMQEIENWPCYQMGQRQSRVCPCEWDKILRDFEISPNQG